MNLPAADKLICLLAALLASSNAISSSLMDNFKDPQDGMFDTSHWLAERKGFFPIPIIITEPAVGVGAGAALLFLHDPFAGKTAEGDTFDPQSMNTKGRLTPPSVSGVFGAYTENDSWFVGGAHFGVWNNDNVRYTGALAKASFNLKFFGLGGSQDSPESGLEFNIEADIFLQEIKFRIKDSDFFIGANYLFLDTKNEFKTSSLPIEIPNIKFDSTSASTTFMLEYDSRDTVFTPNNGISAALEASLFREALGGDHDFEKYKTYIKYFTQLGKPVVLGLRGELEALDGDITTPYYQYPFISMRGIPVMRYQGETVGVAEAEVRWNYTFRWSLVFFGGAGKAQSVDFIESEDDTVYSKGVGMRYFVARRFGAHAGFDIAWGPEDTAFYLTFGQAWY